MTNWSRDCPKCGEEISYSRKWDKIKAEKLNTNCRSCSAKERKLSIEVKEKISKSLSGKPSYKRTSEICKKNSESLKGKFIGKKSPRYKISNYDIWLKKYGKGEADKRQKESNKKIKEKRKLQIMKPWTNEARKNARVSTIKRIKDRNGIIFPNYNKKVIPIIEQKAKELGITDLQHAENGSEFHIKELGYWVDGYSKEKNIVIEYYEKAHEKKKERDERRKQEIIKYLGCKFIIIKE